MISMVTIAWGLSQLAQVNAPYAVNLYSQVLFKAGVSTSCKMAALATQGKLSDITARRTDTFIK